MLHWVKKSIARRTLLTVLVAVVVVFSSFAAYVSLTIRSFYVDEKQTELQKDASLLSEKINGFFQRYVQLVNQMATNEDFIQMAKEVKDRNNKRTHPLFERVAKQLVAIKDQDKNLALVYVGLSDANDLVTSIVDYNAAPDYVLRERPWYKEMMANGKVTLSDPYIDGVTGKLVISISAPILDGGKDVGAVAIDFMIDDIVKMLDTYKIGQDGYTVLSTAIDTLVVYPKKDYIMKKKVTDVAELSPVVTKMKTAPQGLVTLGDVNYAAYNKVGDLNWLVTAVIPTAEVNAEVNDFVFFVTSLLVVLGLLLLGILYLTITRSLKPIPLLLEGIQQLKQGDLTNKIQLQRSDEMGQISDAVNELGESLRSMFGKLHTMTETMEHTSTTLIQVSEFTNTSTLEISNAITEIAIAITNTATDSQDGVTEVHQFSRELDKVAEFNEEINHNTERATKLSQEGSTTLHQLANQSVENQRAVKVIRDIVQEMDESTKEITGIIDIISGISNQTNLLALNASIEAARAGEAGKGFSVVAEEIRKLAEQTSKSADEINKKIGNIRQKSQEAVGYTENSGAIAEQAEQMVVTTSKTFAEIADLLGRLFAITDENRKSSNTMTKSKDVMTEKIENISREVENTSAAMEEISATTADQKNTVNQLNVVANKLYDIGGELKQEIDKYKM